VVEGANLGISVTRGCRSQRSGPEGRGALEKGRTAVTYDARVRSRPRRPDGTIIAPTGRLRWVMRERVLAAVLRDGGAGKLVS
jgi:hypothetical protein